MHETHPLNGILCLTAITPLHPGAGSGLGLIDNPIVRERTTGFPFIQAPSLKGVMRAEAENVWKNNADKKKSHCLFGPERSGSDHHEGALVLNDARILAMPVRSFKGLFVWVTSPQVLYRFFRDFSMTGRTIKENNSEKNDWKYMEWLAEVKQKAENKVQIVNGGQSQLLINSKLFLEEYEISAESNPKLNILSGYLSVSFFDDKFLQDLFKTNLVVLNDDIFRYFVEHATQIEANIAIDQDTGTTSKGSLRYTEFLPEQTLFYSSYRLSGQDYSKKNQNPAKLHEELIKEINFLQIGGDGTTGKGFIHIKSITAVTDADRSKAVSKENADRRKEQEL